jgi:hypothetical protein
LHRTKVPHRPFDDTVVSHADAAGRAMDAGRNCPARHPRGDALRAKVHTNTVPTRQTRLADRDTQRLHCPAGTPVRGNRNMIRSAALLAPCMLVLAACVSSVHPLRGDGTALIAGSDTAGMSAPRAANTVLVEAARLTMDHDARFFRIVQVGDATTALSAPRAPAIRPGADVTIKLYDSEPDEGAAGWDAQKILAGDLTGVSIAFAAAQPVPARGAPPSAPLHCTAYGCNW